MLRFDKSVLIGQYEDVSGVAVDGAPPNDCFQHRVAKQDQQFLALSKPSVNTR